MEPKKNERSALDVSREHVENLDPILHIVTVDELNFDSPPRRARSPSSSGSTSASTRIVRSPG